MNIFIIIVLGSTLSTLGLVNFGYYRVTDSFDSLELFIVLFFIGILVFVQPFLGFFNGFRNGLFFVIF